jgi:hypothetical protein
MFIPTRVIFCETTCDQMMKNDFPLCEFILVETINTGAKQVLGGHVNLKFQRDRSTRNITRKKITLSHVKVER